MQSLREILRQAEYPQWWLDLEPGEQLKKLREEMRISQRQLSATTGVRQATISRLERGGDAKLAVWTRLFGFLGYDFVVACCGPWEDLEDLQEHERRRRAENQRESRFRYRRR